jgi:hypothetical protein
MIALSKKNGPSSPRRLPALTPKEVPSMQADPTKTDLLERSLIALCERIAAATDLVHVNIAAGETLNELLGVDQD